jgi:hypothetical protein
MVILTLPTGRYMAGAAAAVALTAVVGLAAPRLPAPRPRVLAAWRPRGASGSWAGFAVLAALVALGFLGPHDPLGNLLPLTVWTLVWVGLTFATLVLGDLWRPINPWTGPVAAARRALGRGGGMGLARAGYWPAVAGFFAFAWFEIVSVAPDDPAVLARAVLGYWCLVFVLGVLEGEDWLARGEALTVFYAMIAKIAPLWRERNGGTRLMAGLPGAQILAMAPLPASGAAFVTLVLASVSFDGLSDTFRWLALIGVNPLEFPGRSAVVGANTAGLVGAWALTAGVILGAIALGNRLGGAYRAGPAILSFLPIAAGYHAAHYLVSLLGNGQYAVAALNDPLGRGWRLVGLPDHGVSFAFLTDRAAVTAIWNAQFALILGAHVLAVLLSIRLAPGAPARAHLPMTALMVLYTVFGLWLLSAPTGA